MIAEQKTNTIFLQQNCVDLKLKISILDSFRWNSLLLMSVSGFFSVPILLLNVTIRSRFKVGLNGNTVGKIAQVSGTLGNHSSPLPKERYCLWGWTPWGLNLLNHNI